MRKTMLIQTNGVRCERCGQSMPAGTPAIRESGPYRYYHTTSCQAAADDAPELATERQIAYALDLQAACWTPAVFGGRRYDRGALAAMTREQAGQVIDALVSERQLQNGY